LFLFLPLQDTNTPTHTHTHKPPCFTPTPKHTLRPIHIRAHTHTPGGPDWRNIFQDADPFTEVNTHTQDVAFNCFIIILSV